MTLRYFTLSNAKGILLCRTLDDFTRQCADCLGIKGLLNYLLRLYSPCDTFILLCLTPDDSTRQCAEYLGIKG